MGVSAVPPATIPDNTSEVVEEALEATEIKRLAAGGAVLVAARGAALQLLSFAANIVLAHLLAPRDFGLVALGNTIIVFGDLMANSGASLTLIRSETTPQLEDLRAIMGFQLGLTSAITLCVLAISVPLGSAGALSAVMSLALPLLAWRSAPTVMLERSLAYRKLVSVEITENVVYFSWAIATVVAGFGVWGLATGVVVRIVAGTVVLNVIGPVGWLRPSWSWSRLHPVIGFGARVQITSALNFVRDQMMNVALAAVSGVTTLGLWTLAVRAIGIPMLLFEALWRVAFPAITRLMAVGEDTRAIVERSIGMVATAGTAPLAALAACGPALIPAIFGPRWAAAADALPPSCVGPMIVVLRPSHAAASRARTATLSRRRAEPRYRPRRSSRSRCACCRCWPCWPWDWASSERAWWRRWTARRAAVVTGARLVPAMAGPVIAGVLGGAAAGRSRIRYGARRSQGLRRRRSRWRCTRWRWS